VEPVEVPQLVIGVVVLVVVVIDLLWTTLWVGGGAGPLTMRLSSGTWGVFRRSTANDVTLSLAGPVVLTLTLLTWLGLLWAGWTFLFVGGEPSLLSTRDYQPAVWPDHGYFVAYSMFTMGNGDFTPASSAWQVATSLTTGSGMLLVTLSITYVLSVLRAVTQARSFASSVTGLGTKSEEHLQRGWNDDDQSFEDLEIQLFRLSSHLDSVTEQHLSYPILHYYRSIRPRSATPRAVAMLDDVLLLLETAVPERYRINAVLTNTLESSIENYVEVLETEAIDPSTETPPRPDLEFLRELDVPTVANETFDEELGSHRSRRQRLQTVVEQSAWDWPTDG